MERFGPTMFTKKQMLEMYKGVNLDFTARWEEGVEHHPKSIELAKHLESLDFLFCGDALGWKFGGDGDNGEALLYSLDCYFERLDLPPLTEVVNVQSFKDGVAEFASKLDRIPEEIRAMSGVPDAVTKELTPEQALQRIADDEAGPKESGVFGTKPTRWWDDPHWRCANDSVSVRLLKTEHSGNVCACCYGPVWLTFPEDKDGPLDL